MGKYLTNYSFSILNINSNVKLIALNCPEKITALSHISQRVRAATFLQ
jgi:hypothetical protein